MSGKDDGDDGLDMDTALEEAEAKMRTPSATGLRRFSVSAYRRDGDSQTQQPSVADQLTVAEPYNSATLAFPSPSTRPFPASRPSPVSKLSRRPSPPTSGGVLRAMLDVPVPKPPVTIAEAEPSLVSRTYWAPVSRYVKGFVPPTTRLENALAGPACEGEEARPVPPGSAVAVQLPEENEVLHRRRGRLLAVYTNNWVFISLVVLAAVLIYVTWLDFQSSSDSCDLRLRQLVDCSREDDFDAAVSNETFSQADMSCARQVPVQGSLWEEYHSLSWLDSSPRPLDFGTLQVRLNCSRPARTPCAKLDSPIPTASSFCRRRVHSTTQRAYRVLGTSDPVTVLEDTMTILKDLDDSKELKDKNNTCTSQT